MLRRRRTIRHLGNEHANLKTAVPNSEYTSNREKASEADRDRIIDRDA
jgi:hypothetical protein